MSFIRSHAETNPEDIVSPLKQEIAVLKDRIRASRRVIPSDLVLKKGRVVNVFSCAVEECDVAIHQGFIVGLGED